MKAFICKFSSEEDIEHRIGGLVSREKKRLGNNLRVFCLDEPIQKRLELAGISAEILHDFQRDYYVDEPSWEKAYQLSDELHASVENNDTLKYSGINFLTLEYNIVEYILAIKFSRLCRRMVEENCEILILVLTKPFNAWLRDINSSAIKTVRYGNSIKSLMKTKPLINSCDLPWRSIPPPQQLPDETFPHRYLKLPVQQSLSADCLSLS